MPIEMPLPPIAFIVSTNSGLPIMRTLTPLRSAWLWIGFFVYRLRVPPSIQPSATSLTLLSVILARISSPIGPSMTLRMWASSRNTNGMLKTLTSGTTEPTGPSEMRAIWIAPTWACSIISFSPPSTMFGNICSLSRPLVALSSFSPRCCIATTLG